MYFNKPRAEQAGAAVTLHIVFEKCPVQISARLPAILTEVSRGFSLRASKCRKSALNIGHARSLTYPAFAIIFHFLHSTLV
jgi:hypothetical protein